MSLARVVISVICFPLCSTVELALSTKLSTLGMRGLIFSCMALVALYIPASMPTWIQSAMAAMMTKAVITYSREISLIGAPAQTNLDVFGVVGSCGDGLAIGLLAGFDGRHQVVAL